ncbi:hypothetical protein BJ170DRAFT_685386 [Xylariales sp. AK1849]|nr:hypothetical protein BJ170DRAFT_685386 [Xylariales sp. AK1849]
MAAAAVQSSIHFLTRDPLFDTVKPYDRRGEGLPDRLKTNATLEVKKVSIQDAREVESSLSTHGFFRLKLDTELEPEDFQDSHKVANVYLPQLAQALQTSLGASRVQIFDFTRRRRHPDYPFLENPTEISEFRQPAYAAHVDETYQDAMRVLKKLNPKEYFKLSKLRWQVVIAWKPLRGPVRDWPLALCDVRTVDPGLDLRACDVIEPTETSEEYCLHHAPTQKWYYLRDQMPNEVWVMLQSASDGSIGVPHAAFPHPESIPSDTLRESVDARMLVFYED